MTYLFLIPISLGLGLLGLAAFFWCLRHDQYDDMLGAAERVLMTDDTPLPVAKEPAKRDIDDDHNAPA